MLEGWLRKRSKLSQRRLPKNILGDHFLISIILTNDDIQLVVGGSNSRGELSFKFHLKGGFILCFWI